MQLLAARPWEAAAKYAYFKAFWEGPLPEKQVRSKRSSSEVSARPSHASARSAFMCRLFVAGDVHQARGKEGKEGGEAGGKSRKKGGGERGAGSGGPGHARAAVQRSAAAWQPGADAADAEPSAPLVAVMLAPTALCDVFRVFCSAYCFCRHSDRLYRCVAYVRNFENFRRYAISSGARPDLRNTRG